MSQQLAQEFIDALHALEEGGEIESLLAQFAEDAELTNVNLQEPMRGAEGVRKFWEDYRSLFSEVYSEFSRVVVQGNDAALEWSSKGKLAANDASFQYDGVSMLTYREGKVASFRGYFDQLALTKRVEV